MERWRGLVTLLQKAKHDDESDGPYTRDIARLSVVAVRRRDVVIVVVVERTTPNEAATITTSRTRPCVYSGPIKQIIDTAIITLD